MRREFSAFPSSLKYVVQNYKFQHLENEEKKMSKKYHVRERQFLNVLPEMRAYVIAVVEDTRERPICCDDQKKGGEIVFELADCYDDIALHFYMSTFEERENSLHKARKLAEVTEAFHRAIELEVEAINQRHATAQHARAAGSVH